MALPKARGACAKCGKDFTSTGMAKHLPHCVGAGDARHVTFDVGPGTWWVHLAVAPEGTLRDVDELLRGLWLDCCGHMSAFRIGETRFVSVGGAGWQADRRSMDIRASAVLDPGTTFTHTYDFGSTTRLRGRVLANVASGGETVRLLARNEAILWPCGVCGAAATRICGCCHDRACGACRPPCWDRHSFEELSLPVVNSPRMGVCGYGG